MCPRWTLLQSPAFAAVSRCENAAVGPDRPPSRLIVGRESDRIEMIFSWGGNRGPFFSAVPGRDYDPPRAHDKSTLPIVNEKSVESYNQARVLTLPLKATVRGIKNHSICAYRPTMSLVAGESNGADGIALR